MIALTGALALAAACSKAGDAQRAEPRLAPLPAAEIRARLPNHIVPDRAGRCEHGPLLILPAGRFEAADRDIGRSSGDYVINDGVVTFDDHGAPDGLRFTLELFSDGAGHLYVRDAGAGAPKPLRLDPPDPRALGAALKACEARLPAPSAPGAGR